MLAHVEAYIDFEADEVSDHVTEKVFSQLKIDVSSLITQIEGYLNRAEIS